MVPGETTPAGLAASDAAAPRQQAEVEQSRIRHLEQAIERLSERIQRLEDERSGLTSGVFGDGPGADTYSAWFDEHLGNELADSGVLGLAGRLRVALGSQEGAAASGSQVAGGEEQS